MKNRRTYWWLTAAVLFVGLGLGTRAYFSARFHKKLIASIEQNIEAEFTGLEQEAKLLLNDGLDPASPQWDQVGHYFLAIDSTGIVAWNRNDFLPAVGTLPSGDSLTFERSSRGDYLVGMWRLENGPALYGIIGLTVRYPIINNFLASEWDKSIFPIGDLQIFGPSDVRGDPIRFRSQTLFKILPEKPEARESLVSFLLLLFGIAALGFAVASVVEAFEVSYSHDIALIFLYACLFGMRLGMIAVNWPSLYLPSDVFDPKIFASSSLNASLGDLLFNVIALLIVVVYLFMNFRKFRFVRWMLQLTGGYAYVAGGLCLLACFYGLLFPFDFVEVIYHNSTLTLDITQSISFSTARIAALASVLGSCLASFLFIHVFFSLALHLYGQSMKVFFVGLVVAALVFVGQFLLAERILWTTVWLGLVFFSILRFTGLAEGVPRVSFKLFIYLIFSLSVFSFQSSWGIRLFYKERQVQDQFRFGKDFLTDRDVLGEYLLDRARLRIAGDQFIQTRMAGPLVIKSAVVDKIRRVYLSNYFDRYEISIKAKLEGPGVKTESDRPDSLQVYGNFQPTGYNGITYMNASDGSAIKRYHVVIPIFYQRPVGVIELDLSLKRVIPDNVYPELLVDNRFNQIYRNKDFSYAVYNRSQLVSSFGPFNYERDFEMERLSGVALFESGIVDHDYFHIAIEDPDGPVAIVSAATYPATSFVTNFSFWFVLGLAVLFFGQGIFGFYSYLKGQKVNYTARIQVIIFLAFLLPVLAVSVTTLTLIGRANEDAIRRDFLERSVTISQRIASLISEDSTHVINPPRLENWIEENAATSKTDISVYAPGGKLIATSQPALFDDQLVSNLMDRKAWKRIALEKDERAVTEEQIGKLKYNCAYSAVLSPETGALQAIVALPFFESATFLQRSQGLILSNILIVFVVVFILFSLLSFWAASSITFPIRFITRTLGQTTLTGINKPLKWNSSDEIGTLVNEYNRMVQNLEESKSALAQSEKESAWREMARQVAHEIKNPLTPMKLTLQQMENALRAGTLSNEKSQKSVEVLLKQVDILNQIAASFSTFASMPAPSPQEVEINQLVRGTVELFEAATDGTIKFEPASGSHMVSVDPTSFSRALSNLVINALQARKDDQQKVDINVSIAREDRGMLISIRDNGSGMSAEVQEKIFQPQFTTKQSGSGLGLAMTRQIIRQAGGTIWFESSPGGTTFFIQLPAKG